MRFAGAIGFEISKVAFVALRRVVPRMRIVRWVEMAARRFAIGRRAIAEFVNVESVFARGKPGDVGDNFRFRA